MEVKEWTYAEFPDFVEEVPGAVWLETTGDEPEINYIPDVEYANVNGTPLHLQIMVPTSRNVAKRVLPCFVFVQGSAWMEQNIHFKVPALGKFAEKGYVTVIVQYRHSGIAPFPAQAVDTRNAIRFLRVHAEEYGIDPEKIIVAGDSSGGHTAMFAGIRHDDDSTDNLFPGVSAEASCIVNYYGAVSVMMEDAYPITVNHHLPDSPEGMEMGGVNLRERPDLCRMMSAECNIDENTEVAPTLILHGTKDMLVNVRQSVNLYNHMKSVSKEVELYLLRGANHGFGEFWSEEVMSIVDGFIRKHI